MVASEQSAVKSLLSMHRTYAELDEFLERALKEAGYAGVDVQKNPVGSRITVFVTRPGLAIGRRGTGIKDLTERVAAKFPLPNPQIAVSEVEAPELNPRIMASRISQIVSRGTAFRRAAKWTMNSIMAAGAAGVEIGVAGKLRSDRSHKEKYRMGVVPKSGEASTRVVREATTDVLLKLGLYGIKVKIALKDAVPPMVEFVEQAPEQAPEVKPEEPKAEKTDVQPQPKAKASKGDKGGRSQRSRSEKKPEPAAENPAEPVQPVPGEAQKVEQVEQVAKSES